MLEELFEEKDHADPAPSLALFFDLAVALKLTPNPRSTNASIAISVILTELAKGTQKVFVPFEGQTIQAPL